MQQELSLKDLYLLMKKHFFTITIITILGAIIAAIGMMLLIKPTYSSTAQLLVNQKNTSSEASAQYSEIQTNIQLINTYRDILLGQEVLTKTNNNLGGKYDVESLKSVLQVNQSPNSQSFYISATMQSPEEAQKLVAEVTSNFEATLKEVYGKEGAKIYVLSPASFEPNKVGPSLSKFLILGAFAGLLVSLAYAFINAMLDTTVKDESFLNQLGLINLGEIYELNSKELHNSRLSTRKTDNRSRRKV
ncbi:YveK family protein [Vaginisenegalia massiliensis]|uniref:YveK family protein n=1 Tax=Vaginisenegalia massiliensis TaxID=2058294 RepID=UPI000F545229|nr:Wzz/FepE/Etk N-terminal domain-containing protein [Vaginisenegalia massiliensis]